MLNTNTNSFLVKKLLRLDNMSSFGSNESRSEFRDSANNGDSDWVDSIREKSRLENPSITLSEINERIEIINLEILEQSSLVSKLKIENSIELGFQEFKLNSMRDGRDLLLKDKERLLKKI